MVLWKFDNLKKIQILEFLLTKKGDFMFKKSPCMYNLFVNMKSYRATLITDTVDTFKTFFSFVF